jgi:shikimate kinase
MEFYDSDQEIEKRTGADVGWVFDVEGEEGFVTAKKNHQ